MIKIKKFTQVEFVVIEKKTFLMIFYIDLL